MAQTRQVYQINAWQGASVEDITRSANFHLQSIAERLDKLEGLKANIGAEAAANNTAGATLTTSGTTISTVDLGTVNAGDRIHVFGLATITKDATPESADLRIGKASGAATIEVGIDGELIYQRLAFAANEEAILNPSGVIKVTGDGTLVLRLFGYSMAGTANIAQNNQLYALVLKKG